MKRRLTEDNIKDLPKNRSGAYQILAGDDTVLCFGSSINDIRQALKHFFDGVQPPFTLGKTRDTEATKYVEWKYYLTYPPEDLQFDYQETKTKEEAPELRRTWREAYREQYGREPPLSGQS